MKSTGLTAVTFGLAFLIALPLWAAKPTNLFGIKKPSLKNANDLRADTLSALRLPAKNRVKAIQSLGPATLEHLAAVAFDSKQPLRPRWRAVTTMGRLFPRRAKPLIEKALQSKEWFLRNSAIISLVYAERKWAVQRAIHALDDKALVVRTAAAQALKKLRALEAEKILWRKLYSQSNYKNGKSLWVRRHIAEALVETARVGQEAKFMQLLGDEDKRVHAAALAALQKITKRPQLKSRKQWYSWWRRQQKSS